MSSFLTVPSPQSLLPTAALLLLAAGCAAALPKATPPLVAPPEPKARAEGAGTAEPAPAPLPFHLPCEDDDLIGCTNGCSEKHTEDCVTLGSIYLTGGKVSIDAPRALGLFRAACDEGSARGCMRLGDAYQKGLLHGDEEEVDCYRRACDAGANQGCVTAARAFLRGRGVPADPVYAATLFGRVCERGNAPACFELARLYASGEGVKKDSNKSFQLFQRACRLGLDEGCLAAGRTQETWSPRD